MATTYVSVSGNIGVGKTTLATQLSKLFGVRHYPEVEANPYLDDFYTDMNRWAFHSQMSFIVNFMKINQAISLRQESAVQERNIYECRVFAGALRDQGILTAREYGTLSQIIELCMRAYQIPNQIIYLTAHTDALFSRIRSRGLDSERKISSTYLNTLQRRYEEWASSLSICPIITVDTEVHDLNDEGFVRELGLRIGLA